MRIGVILASSQANKSSLLFHAVQKYTSGSESINFGCREDDQEKYSYVEISLLVGLLLTSGAVDFIVTGYVENMQTCRVYIGQNGDDILALLFPLFTLLTA